MSAVLKLKKHGEIYYPESDDKPMGETDWHIQTKQVSQSFVT